MGSLNFDLLYCLWYVCVFCNLRTAGVFAAMDFKEGDLVLKDQMLVGSQHSFNKVFLFLIYFFHNYWSCVAILRLVLLSLIYFVTYFAD